MIVELTVVVEVVNCIVKVVVVVGPCVVLTVVDEYDVVGSGIEIDASPRLPVAGTVTHDNRPIPDTANSNNVSAGARKLDLKKSIS